jgi:hypothetical protein
MHKKLLLLFVFCLSVCAVGSAKDGIPHVVKRFNLYNQTGTIGPITLYTPKHSGLFRINTVIVITVANGKDGDFEGLIGFTDKLGVAGTIGCCWSLVYTFNNGDATAATMPIVDKGGQPLTLSVAASGNWQGALYNVYVVVEEL